MSGHDRFEVLAGAVILGEASDVERAQFAAHAASCPRCGPAGADAGVHAAIARAREAETWRPAIGDPVARRIRESGSSRFRSTVGALGAAVALSLALNVGFASGLSSRLLGSFAPPPETGGSGTTAMRIGLESPAPHRPAGVAHAPVRIPIRSAQQGGVRARIAASRVPVATSVATGLRRPPQPSRANDAAAEIPDVLAGLDLDGSGGGDAKHVALRAQRICGIAAREASPSEAQLRPDPSEPCTAPTPASGEGIVRAEGVSDRRPRPQERDRPDEHDDDSR
jgi:hypothetical protein